MSNHWSQIRNTMDHRKHFMSISFVIILFGVTRTVASNLKPTIEGRKHFVLIHGSCHGAWSWYKLVTVIQSSGHNVTALDLAASGVDQQQTNDLQSISDYFRPLRNFMALLPSHQKVVLVGHSLGGLAISQAMENFPHKISVAVFVTALMPGPALNISTLNTKSFSRQSSMMDNRYIYHRGSNNPPTAFIFGPMFLASTVYQKSPAEDLALASMLMRPVPLFSDEDMSKELMLSEKKYGLVKRVYVISEKDLVAKKDFQLWMVERNKPNSVLEIKGSDHMIMCSKPIELWFHLQAIANKYC